MERPSWAQPGRTFVGGVCFWGLVSRCFFMSNIWVNIVRIWGFLGTLLGTWNRQKNNFFWFPSEVSSWYQKSSQLGALGLSKIELSLERGAKFCYTRRCETWKQNWANLGACWAQNPSKRDSEAHHKRRVMNITKKYAKMEPTWRPKWGPRRAKSFAILPLLRSCWSQVPPEGPKSSKSTIFRARKGSKICDFRTRIGSTWIPC